MLVMGVLAGAHAGKLAAGEKIGCYEVLARLGEGGRRAVETYYNWDRVVEDLQSISSAFRLERSPSPPS